MTAAKMPEHPAHPLDTALEALASAFADTVTVIRATSDDQAALAGATRVSDMLEELSKAASSLRTTIIVDIRGRLIRSAVGPAAAHARHTS
ncbi:hypothetical protein EDD27_2987 [Nonomuraea polychroma]|uniref:Uncharacterized protein n=1 Tax=Nonomuraea polychroma TaxID=46176 RepID=A0A438M4A2_9ACTN|nr:hypothetical protein [Nonomuraea polychroma]RVX40572.1 hypothetical protein EDD27_2987 [Nonomuraea polychroma]